MSSSGFYAWRNRPASKREKEDRVLKDKIRQIYQASRGTYGSPRIFAKLKQQGVAIGKKRVERLMRELGLAGPVRDT